MKHFLVKSLERIAPSVAARWYERAWFSTRRYRNGAHEDTLRGEARVRVLRLPDRVCVYEWGNGKPILIIHGWNGRGTQPYAIIRELVKNGYRVISFDAPGHGESHGNESSLFRFVDVVRELAEQYPHVHAIVTHSFGGLVAAYCLNQKIIQSDRLVAIAPPTGLHVLLTHWCRFVKIRPAVVEKIKERIYRRFGRNVLRDVDVQLLVKDLSLPVLVFHDKDDKDLDVRAGMQFAHAFRHSEFVETNQLGHRRILKNDNVIATLLAFLSS